MAVLQRSVRPLTLVALVLTACGGRDDLATAPPPSASAAVSAAPSLPSAPAATSSVAPSGAAASAPVGPAPSFAVGDSARVLAGGLRVRGEASVDGTVLGSLFPGDIVEVLGGPVEADGFTWYEVGNAALRGFVAAGDESGPFLEASSEPPPSAGAASPSASP